MSNKLDPIAQAAYYKKIKDDLEGRQKRIAKFADKDGNVTVRVDYKGRDMINNGEGCGKFFDVDEELTMTVAVADQLKERGFVEIVRPTPKVVKSK